MIQTSCSELLVDTAIHDPHGAYEIFKGIFSQFDLESSPPLTESALEEVKAKREKMLVFDKYGNRCALEYGDNGYISSLGFRFDSQCNDYDHLCYPIFRIIIERAKGNLYCCDGGHTDSYEQWEAGIGKKWQENNWKWGDE